MKESFIDDYTSIGIDEPFSENKAIIFNQTYSVFDTDPGYVIDIWNDPSDGYDYIKTPDCYATLYSQSSIPPSWDANPIEGTEGAFLIHVLGKYTRINTHNERIEFIKINNRVTVVENPGEGFIEIPKNTEFVRVHISSETIIEGYNAHLNGEVILD